MNGRYDLSYEQKADSDYHSEIMRCANCNHPIEQMYHDIYRHITDIDNGMIAGKNCNLCGCNKPIPKRLK